MSSQAFTREFPDPQKDLAKCMDWLANGIEAAFPEILKGENIDGAIYHLTDNHWVMPDMKSVVGNLWLVYEQRSNDTTDDAAVAILRASSEHDSKVFRAPKRTSCTTSSWWILKGGRVLMGSANFTPEALTSQANLLQISDSPKLAALYGERQKLLRDDPSIGQTAGNADWSDPISVGSGQGSRVLFTGAPKNPVSPSIPLLKRSRRRRRPLRSVCSIRPTRRC